MRLGNTLQQRQTYTYVKIFCSVLQCACVPIISVAWLIHAFGQHIATTANIYIRKDMLQRVAVCLCPNNKCGMTHSCVWATHCNNGVDIPVCRHNTYTYMSWLIHALDAWISHACAMTHSYVCHDSCTCVPWLTHICAVTHSCVLCRIHICNKTHSFVSHHSQKCVRVPWLTPICAVTHSCVLYRIQMCNKTHSFVSHHSLKCVRVPWLIYMCAMA